MDLTIVILAAGKGTRMRSPRPKVLHPLAGRSMVEHVIAAATQLEPAEIRLVYGHGGDQMKAALKDQPVVWVEQAEQLGTGHAVNQAMPEVPAEHVVLVLYGDVPLINPETLKGLVAAAAGDALGLLTVELPDPTGYGRIVRHHHSGAVERIVEQKDASTEEAAIREVNTGILAVKAGPLARWLANLGNDNAQGEYYLTDIIEAAVADGIPIATAHPANQAEVSGVNDKLQLAQLERTYQLDRAEQLMRDGVHLYDPARVDFRDCTLSCGEDVVIDVNVILEGKVSLGNGVKLGANVHVKNSVLKDGTEILANSIIEDARVGIGARIGPFARLRPGSELADDVHIGNFVETKKAVIASGSKVNHLSYIGDARIGEGCNIGAGTITCNYDGAHKHLTAIGNHVFIGSNTALVAPIEVGDGATVGAGSTLSQNVQPEGLTLARPRTVNIPHYRRPKKTPKTGQ
ncbi:MAG: bifunctional UDP-N-acetylglucosamine diphosphorylase/glucosamine-1-phosphate N-acetyltransferase GlmU [Gammaproteobacteria bacterium]